MTVPPAAMALTITPTIERATNAPDRVSQDPVGASRYDDLSRPTGSDQRGEAVLSASAVRTAE